MKAAQREYPLFSGYVFNIEGILETDKGVFTIVEYFSERDKERARDIGVFPLVSGEDEERMKELEESVGRAVIPMRLDPSVIEGANIRTKYNILRENGRTYRTYEIEVIRGRPGKGILNKMIDEIVSPKNTGFRYVKFLEEIEE